MTDPGLQFAYAAAAWAAFVPAVALICVAFWYASSHASGFTQFHLFWLGALLFVVPVSVRLVSSRPVRAERLALCAAIGLFTFLPKYLRDPNGPLFSDELAHWRQVQNITGDGRVFHPSPMIPIIEYFPGLHVLAAALRELTGLSTFAVATILLATLHAATIIGVYLIGERVLGSPRAGAVAALVFSFNPSFMYFDSQFAYESLAIVFFVWTLAAAVTIANPEEPAENSGWFVIALVLGFACVGTHHITTYILVFVLLLLAAFATLERGQAEKKRLIALALIMVAAAAGWFALIASDTLSYLAPHITRGFHQVLALINREQRNSRQIFGHTLDPTYERLAAYAAPPAVLALGLVTVWRARKATWHAAARTFAVLAALYFASLPFTLTQGGEEGAHRSWGFSYLGIALVTAPTLVWLASRLRAGAFIATVTLAVMLVGNVSAGLNPPYRFPGPYIFGSDTRSLTPELLDATRWFRETQGPDQKVVTDRYNGLALGAFGDAWTASGSAGFPVWQLIFRVGLPSAGLINELRTSNYRYLLVDTRIAQNLPLLGFYFDTAEPLTDRRRHPPSAAAIAKFGSLPWTIKLYASEHLQVYRFDFSQFRAQ